MQISNERLEELKDEVAEDILAEATEDTKRIHEMEFDDRVEEATELIREDMAEKYAFDIAEEITRCTLAEFDDRLAELVALEVTA